MFTSSWHGLSQGIKWKFGVSLSQLRVRWRCLGNARTAKLCCLHSSLFLLLFSVSICYLLLQVIAELPSSSCTHFCITDWLQEIKKLKKREAVFYIVSSPSGSGEVLLHTGSFSLPQALLWPPSALSFVLLSFLHFFVRFYSQTMPSFCSPLFPSNFYILRNSSCRNKHHLHWKHHQLYQVIFTSWAILF